MKKFVILCAVVVFGMVTFGIVTAASTGWLPIKLVSKNESKLTYVYGTVRQDADGNWYVQNDEHHKSMGIHSVFVNGSRIRVLYETKVKSVGSFVITPDDALAKKGYVVSGSGVGLSSAEFGIGRMLNVYGGVSYHNGKPKLSYTNNEYSITVEQRGNAVRVYHDKGFDLIPAQLTARAGSYTPMVSLFADNYFEVKFYDNNGNEVKKLDEKCNFLFTRSGYRMVDVNKEILPSDGNFWIMGVMEVE